ESRHARAPAVVELPAAPRTTQRQDRHSCGAERFHFAVHRARGPLDPPRPLAPGEAAMRLEQQQCGEEAVGPHEMCTIDRVPGIMSEPDIYGHGTDPDSPSCPDRAYSGTSSVVVALDFALP